MDTFGKQLPNFTLQGSTTVKTIGGGFCTLILYLTVLMYATLKFKDLIQKPNPIINIFFKEDEMTGVALDLDARKVRLAFTVETYLGQ